MIKVVDTQVIHVVKNIMKNEIELVNKKVLKIFPTQTFTRFVSIWYSRFDVTNKDIKDDR